MLVTESLPEAGHEVPDLLCLLHPDVADCSLHHAGHPGDQAAVCLTAITGSTHYSQSCPVLPHLSSVQPGLVGPLLPVIPDYPPTSAIQLPVVESHLLIDLSLQERVALMVHHTDVDDLLAEVLQDLPQLAVLVGPGQAGSDVVAVLVMLVRHSGRDLEQKCSTIYSHH